MYIKGQHVITVSKLRELLNQLPDHYKLAPNQVGNLSILNDGNKIGYIDLGFDESIELYGQPDTNCR